MTPRTIAILTITQNHSIKKPSSVFPMSVGLISVMLADTMEFNDIKINKTNNIFIEHPIIIRYTLHKVFITYGTIKYLIDYMYYCDYYEIYWLF